MAFTKDTVSPYIVGTMRLGAWGAQLNTKQLESYTEECLSMGLKDFDFADIYGDYTTETEFGNVFKSSPLLRNKIRITTKCGIKMVASNRPEHTVKSYDLSSKHIRNSVEMSLKNLKTDYLDVLLLHRPDYLMDPHDVAEVFTQLKKEGKVLEFGVSNFSASQFEFLDSFTPLVTNQLEISLQYRAAFENGTLDQCLKKQIVPTAWSPLGGGAFMQNSSNPRVQSVKVAAKALGLKYDLEIDQILLAWLLRHPSGIIPVLGTSKAHRIKSALKALTINMSQEDWYILWQAATGQEIA